MKISRKEKLILTILISLALIVTAYTISAHSIASNIHESEEILVWSSPTSTFFPWPHTKNGIFPAITVPLNQIETHYYNYIIKSGILIVLTILLWSFVAWRIWKLRKQKKVIRIEK